jgi:hypothetical protein
MDFGLSLFVGAFTWSCLLALLLIFLSGRS